MFGDNDDLKGGSDENIADDTVEKLSDFEN